MPDDQSNDFRLSDQDLFLRTKLDRVANHATDPILQKSFSKVEIIVFLLAYL